MGFHVRIDEEANRLIRLIQSDPSKVLGHLYPAYLLFLIGEQDEAEVKWLLDSAKTLDSLTSHHIAYAVFAKKFNVKLHTYSHHNPRRPKNVGSINIDQLKSTSDVTRLVKDGRFGMVIDGDEITAITYGTDIIARELGLLGKLPCIVIVDAIPKEHLLVVKLSQEVITMLLKLLRLSIGEFSEKNGDKLIKNSAKKIIKMQDSIIQEMNLETTLRAKITQATKTINDLEDKINSGRSSADPSYLQNIKKERERAREDMIMELSRLPQEQTDRLRQNDHELERAIIDHAQHSDSLFSTIFERKLREAGIRTAFRTTKGNMLSFIGNILKPETLIKIWGII